MGILGSDIARQLAREAHERAEKMRLEHEAYVRAIYYKSIASDAKFDKQIDGEVVR